jgi:hypothetical protein
MELVAKSRLIASVLLACGVFASPAAEARKFDFGSETIATYFRGSFGPSLLGDGAYGLSSGADTTIDKKVQTNLSGEIGFVISGTRANLRLGAEYLMPRDVLGASGVNASGAERFTLTSKVSAVMPMATLELLPHVTPTSKVLIGVGAGYALVSLENVYTMTDTGTNELHVSSFTEKAQTQVPVYQGYVAYERLFTDTVTAVLDVGYRYLPVSAIQSAEAATTITGSHGSGEALKNSDGSTRTINLGGAYVGLAFRFYIGL